MNSRQMTPGEIIRALIPTYYKDSHALNLAVNEHRRVNGFKNWYAAAADLLERRQSGTGLVDFGPRATKNRR